LKYQAVVERAVLVAMVGMVEDLDWVMAMAMGLGMVRSSSMGGSCPHNHKS